jgi:hypothetical protein
MHVCGLGYAHLLEPGYAHASSKLLSQPTEKLNEYMHDESDF